MRSVEFTMMHVQRISHSFSDTGPVVSYDGVRSVFHLERHPSETKRVRVRCCHCAAELTVVLLSGRELARSKIAGVAWGGGSSVAGAAVAAASVLWATSGSITANRVAVVVGVLVGFLTVFVGLAYMLTMLIENGASLQRDTPCEYDPFTATSSMSVPADRQFHV